MILESLESFQFFYRDVAVRVNYSAKYDSWEALFDLPDSKLSITMLQIARRLGRNPAIGSTLKEFIAATKNRIDEHLGR